MVLNMIKYELVFFDSYGINESDILKNNMKAIKTLAKELSLEDKIKFKANTN